MKFTLSTSAYSYSEEDKVRYEKLGFEFTKSTSFREKWVLNTKKDVSIEFKTLDELIAFSKEFGSIIIEPGEIEIYDDYRE